MFNFLSRLYFDDIRKKFGKIFFYDFCSGFWSSFGQGSVGRDGRSSDGPCPRSSPGRNMTGTSKIEFSWDEARTRTRISRSSNEQLFGTGRYILRVRPILKF